MPTPDGKMKWAWEVEIERLRAALQKIADDDVDPDLKGRADILSGIAWAALDRHAHTQTENQNEVPK